MFIQRAHKRWPRSTREMSSAKYEYRWSWRKSISNNARKANLYLTFRFFFFPTYSSIVALNRKLSLSSIRKDLSRFALSSAFLFDPFYNQIRDNERATRDTKTRKKYLIKFIIQRRLWKIKNSNTRFGLSFPLFTFFFFSRTHIHANIIYIAI